MKLAFRIALWLLFATSVFPAAAHGTEKEKEKANEQRSSNIDFEGEVVQGVKQPLDSLSQISERNGATRKDQTTIYEKKGDFREQDRELVRDISGTY